MCGLTHSSWLSPDPPGRVSARSHRASSEAKIAYNFQNLREYELSGSANQFSDFMSKVGLFR